MEEKAFLNTHEVAKLLDINEKMVYALISEKGLPATKATGKWLFPKALVEQWLENQTINYPKSPNPAPPYRGLLTISGSNDIPLDHALSLFNRLYPEHVAAFANLGSLGGIRTLRRGLCHVQEEDEKEYNFRFARSDDSHRGAPAEEASTDSLTFSRTGPSTVTLRVCGFNLSCAKAMMRRASSACRVCCAAIGTSDSTFHA